MSYWPKKLLRRSPKKQSKARGTVSYLECFCFSIISWALLKTLLHKYFLCFTLPKLASWPICQVSALHHACSHTTHTYISRKSRISFVDYYYAVVNLQISSRKQVFLRPFLKLNSFLLFQTFWSGFGAGGREKKQSLLVYEHEICNSNACVHFHPVHSADVNVVV